MTAWVACEAWEVEDGVPVRHAFTTWHIRGGGRPEPNNDMWCRAILPWDARRVVADSPPEGLLCPKCMAIAGVYPA